MQSPLFIQSTVSEVFSVMSAWWWRCGALRTGCLKVGVEGRRIKVVARVKAAMWGVANRAMWDMGPQRGLGAVCAWEIDEA